MAFSTKEEGRAYAKGRQDERKAVLMGASPIATPKEGSLLPPSNTRFRSFAERYLIERATHFRADHIDEDAWRCIQDARRAYKQIEAVGRTVRNDNGDDGTF